MAKAAVEILGDHLSAGVVVTKYGHSAGYHSQHRFLLAKLAILYRINPDSMEQMLSGSYWSSRGRRSGVSITFRRASALLPLPVSGISLEDLQTMTTFCCAAGQPSSS